MSETIIHLKDPTEVPTYPPSAFQRGIEGLLYEPRDSVFVRLSLQVVLLMVPLIALLYWRFSWWLAVPFWLVQLPWQAPPVILMLHCTMHRPFVKKYRWLNQLHPYLMSALFGIPTGYKEHHLGIHHAENNLRADISTTMRYQRDNFFHWLMYLTRFFFLGHFELARYLTSKNRNGMMRRALSSDAIHVSAMVGLSFLNWRATLVAFIVPYVVVRVMMMMGNWGQHAFLDPVNPGNSFLNSITCINSGYNARCFNDGYHIGHHTKQNRHWTELPTDFLANLERYRQEGCIVFEGVDFFMVSLLLFTHQHRFLARRFVRMPGDTRSEDEIVALLHARLARFTQEMPEGAISNA